MKHVADMPATAKPVPSPRERSSKPPATRVGCREADVALLESLGKRAADYFSSPDTRFRPHHAYEWLSCEATRSKSPAITGSSIRSITVRIPGTFPSRHIL